jgi:aspartyl-tRNA(Asn)/glutamyl-tRNA(Gln) amidotransferase subunit B
MKYEVVIGLEVHAQLQTLSKIFSATATAYGAEANTQASEIDLGMPGVLPVLNQKAVELAILFGLSVEATINQRSIFARKNYFYPDLPKGYQISQFDQPIVIGGHLDINTDKKIKRINLTRAHLEEDAGKSLHMSQHKVSGIDLNRAGTPLLEIVSEPDLRSAAETVTYLKKLHQLVRYLGVCDGNMQEGSFRCDVNISLRPFGQNEFGTRAEIKNVNSFKFVEQAINYEIARQTELLDNGEPVSQETRQYDPNTQATYSMRSKEEAHDYRYFPDPDLLPVDITDEEINSIKATLPELPWVREQRYIEQLQLNAQDAKTLTQNKYLGDFFEETLAMNESVSAKSAANLILVDLTTLLNKKQTTIQNSPISAAQCSDILSRINDNTISNNMGRQVLNALWQQSASVDEIIARDGLKQMDNTEELKGIITTIMNDNPAQVEELRQGKTKLISFFVGKVMQQTKGKANPQQVNQLLKELLK